MKFESILQKNIDEKLLANTVFKFILESTADKMPYVSAESRKAIEEYLIGLILKDMKLAKLIFEEFEEAYNSYITRLGCSDGDPLYQYQEKCTNKIAKLKDILRDEINQKLTEDSKEGDLAHIIFKKYQIGTKLGDTEKKKKNLRNTIGNINDTFSEADISLKRGDDGKDKILEKIGGLKNDFKLFNETLDSLISENCEKDTVKNIWINLLIDAISVLKMNDRREKVHLERVNEIEKEKRKRGNPISVFDAFNKIRRVSSYGIEEIVGYFDEFIKYESVLYGMNKHYRDHKKHVIQVWALGIALIHELHKKENNIRLNDKYKTSLNKFQFDLKNKELAENRTNEESNSIVISELWSMWTIIAFCHDLGYPIEKTSQINKQAKEILSHFGNMDFTELGYSFNNVNSFDKFLSIVSSKVDATITEKPRSNDSQGTTTKDEKKIYRTTVQEKHKDKLAKSLEDYKHGIFSSLLLYKNLTYFQETDYSSGKDGKLLSDEDARQFYIRKEILRSIAGHTCPKLYHIRLDTLAFLLILCDELQEWNRPKAENIIYSTKEVIPNVQIEKFELSEDKNLIEISMSYDVTSEGLVKYLVTDRFKNIHYLLRSGKDDDDRKIHFTWAVKFKNESYILTYNSTLFADEVLKAERMPINGEAEEFSLYD